MPEVHILNHRYRLDEIQATGGMATVYRATDLMLERTVAIKILRTELSDDPEFRNRFRQEAKAAANLSHPNIVTVHDFGLDGGQVFIVMEDVPGTDLKTILHSRGRLPILEALDLIIQACSGIGLAHRAGLVHCDIKPQNMLVTPGQQMKVVDFGIAHAIASASPDEKSEVVWGSPQYFSPEQASGLPPTPASDVYSLGVVLFEMVTGRLPFTGATPEELAVQHREAPPPSPGRLNPEIPPDLEQLLLKVLSKEPSARYRTADQMGQILTGIQHRLINEAGLAAIPAPSLPEPSLVKPPGTYPENWLVNESASTRPGQPDLGDSTWRPAPPDWLTWLLVLLAIIALIGLIPFWLWVISNINPPLA